jgi:Cd2+/Zn2+-exporting ATPase
MKSLGIEIAPEDDHSAVETGTVVHVAVGQEYLGHIVIADEIKKQAADAVRELKKAGVTRTVMLTGDTEGIATNVASALGIDEYHAQLLPEDKVTQVETLLRAKEGTDSQKNSLAFVGDGINDAPVLSRADIGIAMGAMGSDAAIEAADVVLMDDDPRKISLAMRISRKTLRIVRQNITFAIGVKILCLILGALGIANMWIAIFADVGVMVIAVLNALVSLLPIPGCGGGLVAFIVGLLIDAFVIWLADKLLDSFNVDGYKWCVILAAIMALVSAVLGYLL